MLNAALAPVTKVFPPFCSVLAQMSVMAHYVHEQLVMTCCLKIAELSEGFMQGRHGARLPTQLCQLRTIQQFKGMSRGRLQLR